MSQRPALLESGRTKHACLCVWGFGVVVSITIHARSRVFFSLQRAGGASRHPIAYCALWLPPPGNSHRARHLGRSSEHAVPLLWAEQRQQCFDCDLIAATPCHSIVDRRRSRGCRRRCCVGTASVRRAAPAARPLGRIACGFLRLCARTLVRSRLHFLAISGCSAPGRSCRG